jgi:NADPH-dependent curcumin reductase CurA
MARAWHLVSRPEGLPWPQNFELREVVARPLGDGEVRVRNRWLSVDPVTRTRMRADTGSANPSLVLGEPIGGVAVGEVVESRSPLLAPGDKVKHQLGWRDEAVAPAAAFGKLPTIDAPEQSFMHDLGVIGFTAYAGLLRAAQAKAGEILFVSAAGGAVGSAVVQIAKIVGMRVIASAGGEEKCAYVRSLGADAVIDYKAPGALLDKLQAAAPEGIDVYFDNVGGEHLDAALALGKLHARFAICGTISTHNSSEPVALVHLPRMVFQNIRLEGFFSMREYGAEFPDFQQQMAAWIAEGKVKTRETVLHGLEATPEAFIRLFTGEGLGKILVKL